MAQDATPVASPWGLAREPFRSLIPALGHGGPARHLAVAWARHRAISANTPQPRYSRVQVT